MGIALTEKQLEERCGELLPDEQVLAAGVFEPYGALMATGAGAGLGVGHGIGGLALSAATGYAANRGMAVAEHQPPWTALAVTADHVYAFDATAGDGITATRHFDGPPYASWDRTALAVHVSRHVTHFTLAIDDTATGTTWEYTGNQVYKVGGKLVAQLLTDGS